MAGFVNGLRKVGKVWHCKFKYQRKTFHKSTGFENREDAQRFLLEWKLALRKTSLQFGEVPTFGAVMERYLLDNTRACEASKLCTTNTIKKWVIPIIGHLKISEIGPQHLGEIQRHYLETLSPTGHPHSPGGLLKLLTDVRTLLNWSKEYLECRGLELPKIHLPHVQAKVVTTIPAAMVEEFIAAVASSTSDTQNCLGVRFMLFMGLRVGEIVTMRWAWFSHDFRTYTPGQTKGREAEGLPVVPQLIPHLQAWKQEATKYWARRGHDLPPVVFFIRPRKGEWRKNTPKPPADQYWMVHGPSFCRERIKAAAKELSLPGKWGAHKLRHCFATILAELGVANSVIQQLLRHKNAKTTERYIHISKPMKQDAIDRLEVSLDTAKSVIAAPKSLIPETPIHAVLNHPHAASEALVDPEDLLGLFPS